MVDEELEHVLGGGEELVELLDWRWHLLSRVSSRRDPDRERVDDDVPVLEVLHRCLDGRAPARLDALRPDRQPIGEGLLLVALALDDEDAERAASERGAGPLHANGEVAVVGVLLARRMLPRDREHDGKTHIVERVRDANNPVEDLPRVDKHWHVCLLSFIELLSSLPGEVEIAKSRRNSSFVESKSGNGGAASVHGWDYQIEIVTANC